MNSYSYLPNKEYWEQRMVSRFKVVSSAESVMFDEYTKVYHRVLDDYTALLKPYKLSGGGINFHKLELDTLYDTGFSSRLGRYQGLMERLDTLTAKLAKNDLQLMERTLIGIYKDNYYEMFYEVEKGVGYELAFAKLDDTRLKQTIHTAWAKDGREFSDRIWRDKNRLSSNLKGIIQTSIASGQNPRTTAYLLRDATANSFYNSQRVIRTETTAIIAESDKAAYVGLGFTEYTYNATFDNRTSTICGEMDNQKFPFAAMRLGFNAPPLHPNCRSTIEAVDILNYQPPFKYGRDGFGKPIKLDGNMTFAQYKSKYKL